MIFAAPAAAQTGIAGDPISVCVLPDTGGMNPAELIRQPDRFNCSGKQTDYGPGDYWVISKDINRSGLHEPLHARFGSVWQKSVSFYALFADGRLTRTSTDQRGVTPFVQLGAIIEIPIPRSEANVVRVMWRVGGAANLRGILIGPSIATAKDSVGANLKLGALYAGFAGVCLALIMYNLALWGALRHRFQLLYCLMTAILLVYTFSSSGALAWAFPDIANNDRLRTNYLLLGLTGASALIFAKSFFEEGVFRGWLGRYTLAVAALISSMGLLFFVTAPFSVEAADLMFSVVFLSIATVVAPTLWRAWQSRSNYLWIFAIGWGIPILAAIMRSLANLHVIPWTFWLDNSTILSMAVETVMSALAISYRIKLLRDERDDAIANEVMARRLADVDPLTGLLNRRAFLDQAIGRSGDQQLLIADLDHFKRVNETLGHDGGDEVLRQFARLLRAQVPATALVSRMGGEEFAIVSHASDPVEPESLLARLRGTRMPFDLQVTASIGAAHGPLTSDLEWKALYREADSALFAAKSAGRDRVRGRVRRAA